jgi:HAD superfamily hydrolase (TIGR01490 family)
VKQETVVVFDFDKTISRKDSYLPFLWLAIRRSCRRFFAALWLPAPTLLHLLGIIDNSRLKALFLRTVLGNAPQEQVRALSEQFAKRLLANGLFAEAVLAIEKHRNQGHRLILASTSFDLYIEPLAAMLGFDDVVCTRAGWSGDGKLLGAIEGKNCYGQAKLQRIAELLGGKRESLHIIAYSDHHSDAPLLQWSDEAFAVNPTRRLLKNTAGMKVHVLRWK